MGISNEGTSPVGLPAVVAGVFEADPMRPPMPPPGARAVAIRDASGRTVAWAWVVPDHAGQDGQRLNNEAWDWFDYHRCGVPTAGLRLVR